MTDVTAQAFREAAEQERLRGCEERGQPGRTTLKMNRNVALLLAAAEQREQWDRCERERDSLRAKLSLLPVMSEQIATLTAERDKTVTVLAHERDEARATLAQLREGQNLQHELLDLITLMPDSQTQEILDYILNLRDTRRRQDPERG